MREETQSELNVNLYDHMHSLLCSHVAKKLIPQPYKDRNTNEFCVSNFVQRDYRQNKFSFSFVGGARYHFSSLSLYCSCKT